MRCLVLFGRGLARVFSGAQLMGTRMAKLRSCEAYGEFRRLTIRGLRRLSVRVDLRHPLSCGTLCHAAWRNRGRTGEKGP